MPLSRVILAGALHIARKHSNISGSCQTGSGTVLLLSPSCSQGHSAQVRPLHKLMTGNCEMVGRQPVEAGEWMWTFVSALGEEETAGRCLSPLPNTSRSLQEDALCSPREG